MSDYEIDIDFDSRYIETSLEAMEKELDNVYEETAQEVAEDLAERTKQKIKMEGLVETGKLRDSFRVYEVTGTEYEVRSSLKYAHILEEGHSGYWIIPKGHPFLVFRPEDISKYPVELRGPRPGRAPRAEHTEEMKASGQYVWMTRAYVDPHDGYGFFSSAVDEFRRTNELRQTLEKKYHKARARQGW